MAHRLDFVEDFPQIVPDPPLAHVQFSVKWKCVNAGDEDSPEAGVRVDLVGADGGLVITSIGGTSCHCGRVKWTGTLWASARWAAAAAA